MLLIEFVASTAIGHSAESALARKDKQSLPIPVRVFDRMSYRLLIEHTLVLLLAISTHESAPHIRLCFHAAHHFAGVLHVYAQSELAHYPCLFPRSSFQRLVVCHAIRFDSARYALRIGCSSVLAHVHHSALYGGHDMPSLQCVVRLRVLQRSLCRGISGLGGFRQHQVHPTYALPSCADGYSSIALYGLILFYGLTKEELAGRRPLAKFLSIKLIVMFTFYQSFMVCSTLSTMPFSPLIAPVCEV